MRRYLLPLVLLVALSGCATGPSLQSRMATYIGASSQTLVQNFGVPDRQITTDGVEYLAYTLRHEDDVIPMDYDIGFAGEDGFGGFLGAGLPHPVRQYSCVVTFMLKNDKVYSFMLRGNDCG